MATLFISDLHLDAGRPAVNALFLRFLAERAAHAEALYILGDLFEVWLGDDAVQPAYEPLLAGLAAAGVPVHVMHGNRDFLMGAGFAGKSGARLLAEPAVIDLYGVPTLLMHGDVLCTDDVEYQRFRARVRDPEVQRRFLALPLAQRIEVARGYRTMSAAETARKAQDIMDVNADAVADVMRRHGVTRLIHGHTHRPAVHDFMLDGNAAQRIVLGDWYEQGSVLVCDGTGCRLETLGFD